MYDNDGWCVALYIKNPNFKEIEQKILSAYQFKNGKLYLNAWNCNQGSGWWRKYKDKGRAKVVLHKILKLCPEVQAGFIFRSDDFTIEDCFMWKSPATKKIDVTPFREVYKGILSEICGIKWRGNPHLSLPFDSMKEE